MAPSRTSLMASMMRGQLRRWLPICTCLLCLRAACDQQLAFARIVAARLLDIDVLAGGAGQDGRRGVPVVAGGDDQDVDVLVVEDPAKIGDGLGSAAVDLANAARRGLHPAAIDVADISDLDVLQPLEGGGNAGAPAAGAHAADDDLLIGALDRGVRGQNTQAQGQPRGS